MLSVAPIFVLIIIPCVMLVLNLLRWRNGSQWLVAVFGTLLSIALLLISRPRSPTLISFLPWEPKSLFPVSPTLLLDDISWMFSLTLVTLGLSLILTAIARNEQGVSPADLSSITGLPLNPDRFPSTSWRTWSGSLLIISMGLVAVTAGNLLTVILAWAIVDVVEVILLSAQIHEKGEREQVIVSFAVRTSGIIILVLAEIHAWNTGGLLSLSSISPTTAWYLLLASGLRLGVLPLHVSFSHELQLRRGMDTILRLVPAAASLSLFVRGATAGLGGQAAIYLLFIAALVALYSSSVWLISPDELHGRPFWVLGLASFSAAASVSGKPDAALSWGVALLLTGSLLFFASMRHLRLRLLTILGFISLSGLPFTPNWNGVMFYSGQISYSTWISVGLNVSFISAHALLLAGFLRHSMRGESLIADNLRDPKIERWIWLIYPLGLLVLPVVQILIGIWTIPDYQTIPLTTYFYGMITSTLGIGIWYFLDRYTVTNAEGIVNNIVKTPTKLLTFSWIYQPVLFTYRIIQRLLAIVYALLEGDAGILWAIVLFFFLLMFIQG